MVSNHAVKNTTLQQNLNLFPFARTRSYVIKLLLVLLKVETFDRKTRIIKAVQPCGSLPTFHAHNIRLFLLPTMNRLRIIFGKNVASNREFICGKIRLVLQGFISSTANKKPLTSLLKVLTLPLPQRVKTL